MRVWAPAASGRVESGGGLGRAGEGLTEAQGLG